MEVVFVEKYEKLSEMQPGDVAVSKDRSKVFVCGHYFDNIMKKNRKIVLDLSDLYTQYSDDWDMQQPVRMLKTGDRFNIRK